MLYWHYHSFLPNVDTAQTNACLFIDKDDLLSWILSSLKILRVTGKRTFLFLLLISVSQLPWPLRIDLTISGLKVGSTIPRRF